jgi:AmiR/NasT family two-component response regulator
VEQHRLVADLTVAVASRERIGQACGILMSRFVLTADEAFAALSRASQNRNVKVRDLAAEVVRTGTLPDLD